MFAVKKVRGIARIKRKGFKPGERFKDRRGPFPSVAEQIGYAKGAAATGVRMDWSRIPVREVKIASAFFRSAFSPRIRPFQPFRCSVCCAMKLGLGRKLFAGPPGKSRGFCMAYVDGPVKRQRDFRKHGATVPGTSARDPENRMPDSLTLDPLPVRLGPEVPVFIASRLQKLQKVAIRHLVLIDGKRRHLHSMALKFIVPAENFRVSWKPQRCSSGRNFNHPSVGARRRSSHAGGRPADFAVERKLVQHVCERLGVHQAVLDRHIQINARLRERTIRFCERFALDPSVQFLAHAIIIFANFLKRRPIGRLVVGQAAVNRIDAEGEQLVELRMERLCPEGISTEEIPIKGFKVPDIENNAMALRDWAVVKRLAQRNCKDSVRDGPCLGKPRRERFTCVENYAALVHLPCPFAALDESSAMKLHLSRDFSGSGKVLRS